MAPPPSCSTVVARATAAPAPPSTDRHVRNLSGCLSVDRIGRNQRRMSRRVWLLIAATTGLASVKAGAATPAMSLPDSLPGSLPISLPVPRPISRHVSRPGPTAPDRDALQTIARWRRTGRAGDAVQLLPLLRDPDPDIRREAEVVIWILWRRSGHAAVDRELDKGIALMRGGDRAGAIASFTRVLDRAPDFAEAWNRRASALFLEKDPVRALDDCRRATSLDDRHFGAWAGLGYCHAALDEPAAALRAWTRALDFNPNLDGVRRSVQQRLSPASRRTPVII